MPEQTAISSTTPSLALGAPLTQESFDDFVRRLKHDCVGAGVDDHCTADAIFIVQAKVRMIGIDRDLTDDLVICCDDRTWDSPQEYWDDADEDLQAKLDVLSDKEWDGKGFIELDPYHQWDILDDLPDHHVYGYKESWKYVCAHYTKDAAEAFIRRKKHDYREGIRVYVEAQTYSWEYNEIKKALIEGRLVLAQQPQTPLEKQ